jgi:hypothetical protein
MLRLLPSRIWPVRNRATMAPWTKSDTGSACDSPRRFSTCSGARFCASRSRRPRTDRCGLGALATTGHGDVKSLKDRPDELRVRVGKWRVFPASNHLI